jgi:putative ubiquitin-RnfH superfamily antitoxin RatB of RatAB toxin-antitoxin module
MTQAPLPTIGIQVSIVYAVPERQWVVSVSLPAGSTIEQAFEHSGLRDQVPELAAGLPEFGVFHRRQPPDRVLRDGERVEIYRALQLDPMAARRLRADVARRKKPAPLF